jgi:hypothetical protein
MNYTLYYIEKDSPILIYRGIIMVILTKQQKMQLQQEYASTRITQRELSEKYGITMRHIRRLVHGIRRNKDLIGMVVKWQTPATKETEGGNQLFHRSMKEYSYYENDDFWRTADKHIRT